MSRDEGSTTITSPGVSNATTINPARFFTMEGGLGDNIIHVINPASLGSLASVTTSATNSGLPANMQTITIQPGTFPIPINLAQQMVRQKQTPLFPLTQLTLIFCCLAKVIMAIFNKQC